MYWNGRGRSFVRSAWWRFAERRGGVCVVVVGFETWFSGECSVMLGGLDGVMALSRDGGEVIVEAWLWFGCGCGL